MGGGIDKENPLNPKDNRENGVMVFFRDRIGPILNNGWTKFFVMVLFVVYLGVSSWGVSQLREGLERRKLSRYDSYTVAYYDTEDLYFREYPYRVNVSFELICYDIHIRYILKVSRSRNKIVMLKLLTKNERMNLFFYHEK